MAKRHISNLTPRFRAALEIRDAVLPLLIEGMNPSDTPFEEYIRHETDGLQIVYRVPKSRIIYGDHKSIRHVLEYPIRNLEFGLQIWSADEKHKVLFVEWDTDGNVSLVGFKRGAWEQRALKLSAPTSTDNAHDNQLPFPPDISRGDH